MSLLVELPTVATSNENLFAKFDDPFELLCAPAVKAQRKMNNVVVNFLIIQ